MADENMLFPMLLANLVALFGSLFVLFNLILVFHRRRTSVIRALALSTSSPHSAGAWTPYRRSRRFWIRPGRTSPWWDKFVSQTVVPEPWNAENITIVYLSSMHMLFNLWNSMSFSVFERFSVDSWKRSENGSVDADRSMRFRWHRKRILLKTY